jgi:hypothetical protein
MLRRLAVSRAREDLVAVAARRGCGATLAGYARSLPREPPPGPATVPFRRNLREVLAWLAAPIPVRRTGTRVPAARASAFPGTGRGYYGPAGGRSDLTKVSSPDPGCMYT